MQQTNLEKALESSLLNIGMQLFPRFYFDDLKKAAQMDETTNPTPSKQDLETELLAELFGEDKILEVDERYVRPSFFQLEHRFVPYLLFERFSEIREGHGIQYTLIGKERDLKREEIKKIIKEKQYNSESLFVRYDKNYPLGYKDFYEFYRIKGSLLLFGFSILPDGTMVDDGISRDVCGPEYYSEYLNYSENVNAEYKTYLDWHNRLKLKGDVDVKNLVGLIVEFLRSRMDPSEIQ